VARSLLKVARSPPEVARTPSEVARIALACLDLTSLNDDDSEARIAALCERAALRRLASGWRAPVAAVCVWPRFAKLARSLLPDSIGVAAVANFPAGASDLERAVRDTGEIVQAGAQEVDVVLPYRALLAGDSAACSALLAAVRRACGGLVLKVILETGELREQALIEHAARLALEAGADFLKTSTGKTPLSATPLAAQAMLGVIGAHARAHRDVGFKASGGIRSVADAAVYLDLVEAALGAPALVPARFRIGASALLADIEAVLDGDSPRNSSNRCLLNAGDIDETADDPAASPLGSPVCAVVVPDHGSGRRRGLAHTE
jgi:deoxyribose-phosphate aldolase